MMLVGAVSTPSSVAVSTRSSVTFSTPSSVAATTMAVMEEAAMLSATSGAGRCSCCGISGHHVATCWSRPIRELQPQKFMVYTEVPLESSMGFVNGQEQPVGRTVLPSDNRAGRSLAGGGENHVSGMGRPRVNPLYPPDNSQITVVCMPMGEWVLEQITTHKTLRRVVWDH